MTHIQKRLLKERLAKYAMQGSGIIITGSLFLL